MEMSGEKLIAAPKEKVWSALNDPEVLKACIPGCERVEKPSDTDLNAIAALTLGPIAARFIGKFLLSDLDPPHGYTISGEGQGGPAGSANGSAQVTLTDDSGGTRLAYKVSAAPEGKMAQLDPGILKAAARQMAESFFMVFSAIVEPVAPAHGGVTTVSPGASPYHGLAEDHDHDPSNPHYFGVPVGVLIAATIATISVALTIYKYVHF